MRRRCGIRVLVVALLLGGCSGTSNGPDQTTGANPSTSSTPTTPATSLPATSTLPTSTTTVPVSSVLEVRLVTASYSDGLSVAGDAVTFRPAFQGADEKTARLTPTAAARLEQWLETAAAMSLLDVYNDGRGMNHVPFWEYSFSSGGASSETAFSWFPDEDLGGLQPMVDWATAVRFAMSTCAQHPDLIDRVGCEDWLPSPAEQASLRIGAVVAGEVGLGADTAGAWRLPGEVDADLAEQVRRVLEPVLAADAFAGEVTAVVVAVREDGAFYATAEDEQYERVCFVRWTPERVLSGCQRLLGDVFWAPGTYQEGHLELVVRPADPFREPTTVRYYQTLNDQEPKEQVGLVAGGIGVFLIPAPPPWPMWVEVGNTSRWAMPSLGTCTAVGLNPEPEPQAGLPPAVADTRDRIVAAAVACDSEALAAIPQGCDGCSRNWDLTYSLNSPMHRWYLHNDFYPVHDAAPWQPALWPIVQMLNTDYAVIPGGTLVSESDPRPILWSPILDDPSQDVYVWPAADVYRIRATTPTSDVEDAVAINLEALGIDGYHHDSYCGWSIGIRADGRVLWADDCWGWLP